jgi:hypothetical protein
MSRLPTLANLASEKEERCREGQFELLGCIKRLKNRCYARNKGLGVRMIEAAILNPASLSKSYTD